MSESYTTHQQGTEGIQRALEHWTSRRARDVETLTHPPQVLPQVAARHLALGRVLHWLETRGRLDITTASVLDVGCSDGYGLRPFLNYGFRVDQLHGIDLFADRLARGREILPSLDLREASGTALPFADRDIDLVCEQFCFCHIPDALNIKPQIAAEMMRVSRRYILIHDWRMGSVRKQLYAVSQARIRAWFPGWRVVARVPSQLWPPIGRPLARLTPHVYGLGLLVPSLVGSRMTVLTRD